MINPFTREPSQKFKEAFDGKSLAYVFVKWGVLEFSKRSSAQKCVKRFKGANKKEKTLVYDEMIQKLDHLNMSVREDERERNRKKLCRILAKERNKWGDSPLEKALGNIFNSFLPV